VTFARRALLLICLLLAGCGAPPTLPQPSPPTGAPAGPTPTSGPAPTPTRGPLSNPTPAAILEEPEPTATYTPAPAPVNLPLERIALFNPGPGSQVTSPFEISGRAGPSFNERVHVRLLGEDGRVLAQRTTYLNTLRGYAGPFSTELTFNIPGVAEAGRLELSTDDQRSGRMAHLMTLDLILLAAGAPLVHPAAQGPEQLAILAPRDGAGVRGGRFATRLAGWTQSGQGWTLALFDGDGDPLSVQTVYPLPGGIGETGVVEAEVTYEVPYEQYGRLALYELAEDGVNYLHYTSIEVYLRH